LSGQWNEKSMKWKVNEMIKCQVNQMASWWNAKLTNWQFDQIANWWNDKWTKLQFEEMASHWNDKLTKWHVNETTCRQNVSAPDLLDRSNPSNFLIVEKSKDDSAYLKKKIIFKLCPQTKLINAFVTSNFCPGKVS
jgi:hypothetical protein